MYRKFIPVSTAAHIQYLTGWVIPPHSQTPPSSEISPLPDSPSSPQRLALGTKAGAASAKISHPPNECQWSHVLSLNLCNGIDGAGGGRGQSTGFTVWAPPGHPRMKVRQARPPPAGWLREDGWAPGWSNRQTRPTLWLQEASGHVWLICSSRAPSRRRGKHQGPEARPRVKEHREESPPQCHPCSWNGHQYNSLS